MYIQNFCMYNKTPKNSCVRDWLRTLCIFKRWFENILCIAFKTLLLSIDVAEFYVFVLNLTLAMKTFSAYFDSKIIANTELFLNRVVLVRHPRNIKVCSSAIQITRRGGDRYYFIYISAGVATFKIKVRRWPKHDFSFRSNLVDGFLISIIIVTPSRAPILLPYF